MKKILLSISIVLGFALLCRTETVRAQVPDTYPSDPAAEAGQAWAESEEQPAPIPAPTRPKYAPIDPSGAPNVGNGVLMDNGLWDGAPAESCCSICGWGSNLPPDWYTEQGVRILSRSRARDLGISYEFSSEAADQAGTERLNTRGATPDISAAWYMMIGHRFAHDRSDRDHFVEFSFWGLNNWRDEASYIGQEIVQELSDGTIISHGNLYSGYSVVNVLTTLGTTVPVLNGSIVPPGTDFDRATEHATFYSSFTNNYELNGRITPRGRPDRLVLHPNGKWRRECTPGMQMSYLYGIRFMQINESFRLHSRSTVTTYDPDTLEPTDVSNYNGDYGIVTHNNLLGLQVGAEMMFQQCRWAWGIRSKIGPYVNFADQVSNISAGTPLAPEYVRRLAYSKHEAAMIGEVGFTATYKFRPNLVGRAAYDFIWVPGVALAPEQLQFNTEPVNKLNTNGLAFFHGVSFGLEWLW